MESQEAQLLSPATPPGTVRFAVVIPAYRPEERLLQLIADLSAESIPAIILVDDGSGPRYADIFRRAAEYPKVRLVRHAVNLGKGAALKSGFNEALCTFPNLKGVITADADGQHHPADILQVAERLAAQPDRLVLGTRTFHGDIPLRSRFGNQITRGVMHALVGQKISDTQTGLRGIPAALLPHLLRMETNGYDFELDMLIAVRKHAILIDEVPIRTIYEPGNRTSHFNPLMDSMKIYFVLLRFSSVSLMTAAIDTLVFYLAYRRLGNLAASQALGRLVAVAFNYSMVRRAVFFTKLRHASVLPKYLLLLCLSGSASYAGIQLLNSRFQIRPLFAKLLVESLLFFANFAIQRDFIFGKSPHGERSEDAPEPNDGSASWVARAILAAAAIALVGVVLYGFASAHWLPDTGWTSVGKHRLLNYTLLFAAASAIILLLIPRAFAPLIAGLLLVATTVALGPLAVLAVALFLLACSALGSRLLGKHADSSPEIQICATLLGMAVYIFLMTFMARLPVNYPAVYLVLLAIPIALDFRGVVRRLTSMAKLVWSAGARTADRPARLAAFALLVFVLGFHWLVVPQPEASADGLASHLAVPHNIALHHVMTYHPSRILWSVMPMGADWCYTMVYLLGGEFAARLLNFAMLLLVEAMLYFIARRFVTPAIAYLILALFASTSLVQLVTGSLFIENFLAAIVIAMLLAIWRFGETGERRFLYAAAVIGGTALAIKLGGLAFLVVALPVAIVEIRRQRKHLGARPALVWGLAILLILVAALPTYAIAWRMTGDPLFPFLNQKFPSPLLDHGAVITDYRFREPLTLHTPFDLTFHSNSYFEGRPGSMGFQYLLFVPLGLIGLIFVRRRAALSAAFLSVAGALVILTVLPNARYLYPSLPLLLVPFAALLGWLTPGPLRRVLVVLAVACVVLNIWFLPSSNYYHGNFYERSPLSQASRQTYIHNTAPIREVGDYMNREHPGAPVLLADGSDLAPFNAEVYVNGWHQYGAWARMQLASRPRDLIAILNGWNVHYIAAPKPNMNVKIRPQALADLLKECAVPEFQTTWLYLARVDSGCQSGQAERAPLVATPGLYDDTDPAIVYRGPWTHDSAWSQPFSHTVTYSNLPGSEVRIAFRGDKFHYVYSRAPNRGQASLTIDGVLKAKLDLYAPDTHWQTSAIFDHLGAGQHLAIITVLPDKNPKSSERFVDVDAFRVEESHVGTGPSAKIQAFGGWLALLAGFVFVARGGMAGWPHMTEENLRRIATYAAGLVLFGWFAFLIDGGLSSWFDADDLMNLNYYWTRSWPRLLKANLLFWSSYYRPGGGLFYMPIYALWGFHPLPFRIAVFVLLCVNFVFLAVVVRQLTASRWAMLVSLLVVGIHPFFSGAYFTTGTVYDVLAYTFVWGAFALYVHMRQSGRVPAGGSLALLLCLLAAALDCKEISVLFPVAVALYELIWHPPVNWNPAAVWRWICREGRFAAIGALFNIAFILGKRYGPESLWDVDLYRPHYSLAAYFQTMSYLLHHLLYGSVPIASWQVAVVLVVMAAIAVASRHRYLIWGIAFILVGILPLAFIAPRGGFAFLVPSVGWAVYCAGLLDWLLTLLTGKRVWLRNATQALVLILLFIELAPWQRNWIEMHARGAQQMQNRFHQYEKQIRALIPAPRKGARILLLTDADGYEDWDVHFLIRLTYGDPAIEPARLKTLKDQPDPKNFDYILDYKENHFILWGGPSACEGLSGRLPSVTPPP